MSNPAIPTIPKLPTPGSIPTLPKAPVLPKAPGAPVLPKAPTAAVPPKPPVSTTTAATPPKAPALPKTPVVAPTVPTATAAPTAPSLPKAPGLPTLPGGVKAPTAPKLPSVDTDKQQEKAVNKLQALKETVTGIQQTAKEETQEVEQVTEEITTPEAVTETPETPEVPAQEEVKETKKRTRKSSKKETVADTETSPVTTATEELITVQLKPTCKDFKVMEDAICNTFNDPEWEELKESITADNAKIIIETDMNATSLKIAVAELCKLRNKILSPYYKYQTNFQNLVSDKPEGILERVKRLNSKGSNDFERRRNGIIACMQFEINGEVINLFELLEQTRERYNFLKGIMDSIEYKTKALITMNSAILMEQKLEK